MKKYFNISKEYLFLSGSTNYTSVILKDNESSIHYELSSGYFPRFKKCKCCDKNSHLVKKSQTLNGFANISMEKISRKFQNILYGLYISVPFIGLCNYFKLYISGFVIPQKKIH